MSTTVTNQEYQNFKLVALQNEPNILKVSLNEIDLIDKSTILLKGKQIQTVENFQNKIVDLLKIPQRFINEYSTLMKGESSDFINFLKTVKGNSNNKEVYLTANNNQITGIQESYMPREIYFKTFEDIMNQKSFEIKNMLASNGDLFLQTINKDAEFQIGRDLNEIFHPGFSLNSTSKGMDLGSYMLRLVCQNGMMRRTSEELLKYNDPSTFWEGLGYLMRNDFVSKDFRSKVGIAQKTLASIAEVDNIRDIIKNASPEVDNLILERFAPYGNVREKLYRNKLDINLLNKDKKKNIPSELTIWEAINGLTDFASHDYHININESARLKMQVHAGGILNKKSFDTQNLIILKDF